MSDMEFLDPAAERRHRILLYAGYGLIAIAIAVAALIMLYLSYGYSLNREGEVGQNGIVFVSSVPDGAIVGRSGGSPIGTTNDRFLLSSGKYSISVSKTGYTTWNHDITVQGGDVQRLTYVRLFPAKLSSSALHSFPATPQFASQSPDRRWLIIKDATTPAGFSEYDLRDPAKPITSEFAIPNNLFTLGETNSWEVVEWSNDNQHCLVKHSHSANGTTGVEYIMLDRSEPAKTINLTTTLGLQADDQLSLFDKKFDRFYIFNPTAKTLRSIDIENKVLAPTLNHVRAYKSHGADTLLYVSDAEQAVATEKNQVQVILKNGSKQAMLRRLPSDAPNYLLDLATYDGKRYVILGATNDKGVYLFKDPILTDVKAELVPSPFRYYPLSNPTAVSFSSSAQFLAMQNQKSITVFDAFNVASKRYDFPKSLDPPQTTVKWMGSDHYTYVSDGKLIVFDFDGQNSVTLFPASPNFVPFFSRDFSSVLSLSATGTDGATTLSLTPLILK